MRYWIKVVWFHIVCSFHCFENVCMHSSFKRVVTLIETGTMTHFTPILLMHSAHGKTGLAQEKLF